MFALVSTFLTAGPAAAAPRHGPAEVVVPGTTNALSSGGSADQFGVILPYNARCPGDSTQKPWYQASSFLDPVGTDLSSINFKGQLPDRGLFLAAFGAPWLHTNVIKYSAVVEVPEGFDVQRFHAADLIPLGAHSAVWEAGVACVNGATGKVSNYWVTDLTFTASTTDPGGFTWTASPSSVTVSQHSSWGLIAGLAAIFVAAGAAYWILDGRDRSRRRRASGARQ
jgi:hypothetical protein